MQEIEPVIASFGVQLSSFIIRNLSDMERAVDGFAIQPHGGLIILPGPFTVVHRDLIISLATRHALPNVHAYRYYPAAKATDRVRRSTLATTNGMRWRRALASALSKAGLSDRRPLSTSVNSSTTFQVPPLRYWVTAARCASRPSLDAPCLAVDTR